LRVVEAQQEPSDMGNPSEIGQSWVVRSNCFLVRDMHNVGTLTPYLTSLTENGLIFTRAGGAEDYAAKKQELKTNNDVFE
jgi:hypothetical protein